AAIDHVEEQLAAGLEPFVEARANFGGDRATETEHAEGIDEVEGCRFDWRGEYVPANQLDFFDCDFASAHGIARSREHVRRNIESDEAVDIVQAMEIAPGAAAGFEHGNGLAKGGRQLA